MSTIKTLLAGAAVGIAVGGFFGVSASVGPARASGNPTSHVQRLTLTIVSSGRGSGAERVFPSEGNLAVAPGVPVQVTVTNFTREFHTFSVPGLHVSALVFPARGGTPSKTTLTFTAWETGSFRWYCAFCAHDGSGHRHAMGGTIYAIIDPSVLR